MSTLIGYKKVFDENGAAWIIKLRIPKDAEVLLLPDFSGVQYRNYNGKCRASKAEVLEIMMTGWNAHSDRVVRKFGGKGQVVRPASSTDCTNAAGDRVATPQTIYKTGTTVHANGWSTHQYACGHGIHFFLDLKQALEW